MKAPTLEQVADAVVTTIGRIPVLGWIVVGFWDWFYGLDRYDKKTVVMVVAWLTLPLWLGVTSWT